MDPTQAETTDLETLEERNDPLPRTGQAGCSEMAGRVRGSRKKSLAYVRLTCDKRSPKQRVFSELRAEEYQDTVYRTTFFLMNRRMRTRMSGGVRGGRLAAALLLDLHAKSTGVKNRYKFSSRS